MGPSHNPGVGVGKTIIVRRREVSRQEALERVVRLLARQAAAEHAKALRDRDGNA